VSAGNVKALHQKSEPAIITAPTKTDDRGWRSMKISVVTPSYNQAGFIERTITSVLEQKGDFYIEYILMDGGSTDGTVDIIKHYERLLKEGRYPIECNGIDFKWRSKADGGQSEAINEGFRSATGHIAGWLNSDDFLCNKSSLATVSKYFAEDPSLDLLIGEGCVVDKNGKELWRWHADRICIEELIYLDDHILQPAAFGKTKLFLEFPLAENYHYVMDLDFFLRVIRAGVTVRKVDDLLACLRIYPETKTESGTNERFREMRRVMSDYGNNRYHHVIGLFYQYTSIVLRKKYGRSRLAGWLFKALRDVCYFLIINTWGR
jgi:glycosyltransferase involved in cell wall biosynthesis